MSCLTSFKSYLTPRNSHEFTVGIKEENSQRERNYHLVFVRRCYLERTWQDVYLEMNILYIITVLQHCAIQLREWGSSKGAPRFIFLIAAIKAHGNKRMDFRHFGIKIQTFLKWKLKK